MRKTNQTNQSETTVSATASAFWGAIKNSMTETSNEALNSIKDITLEATKEKISQAADSVESYCAKKEDGTREITKDTVDLINRNEHTVAMLGGLAVGSVGAYAFGLASAKTVAINLLLVQEHGSWGKRLAMTIEEMYEEKKPMQRYWKQLRR